MVGDKKGGTEVQSGEADRETKSKWGENEWTTV